MERGFVSALRKVIAQILHVIGMPVRHGHEYSGSYEHWADAVAASGGYDAELILHKVAEAVKKVQSGEAVYERDSFLFARAEYAWPLLASLMWIAAQEGGKLNLLDFGGSLGSTYFQHRRFLKDLDVTWSIVEQKHFVEYGKIHVADDRLHFYDAISSCLKEQKPSAVLFSGVLQYLEKPYEVLEEIIVSRVKCIVIDRTPFLTEGNDLLTVQESNPLIFRASYPCWFLSIERLKQTVCPSYDLIAEFDGFETAQVKHAFFKGLIFRLKGSSS